MLFELRGGIIIKNRRGSTLVMTLLVFVVLMISATFILGFMVTENKQSLHHQNKTQAYYIARSGAVAVEAAIIELSENETQKKELENLLIDNQWKSVDRIKIGEGKVNVKCKKNKNEILIKSVGEINNTKETVIKTINIIEKENDVEYKFDMALFANSEMIFKSNTQNNVIGDIGVNSSKKNAIEFTSGFNDKITINIPKGSNYKDVINKPNRDKEISNINYIEKKEDYILPSFPEYPKDMENKGTITTNWDNSNPIISESGYYDAWNLKSNYSLTIDTKNKDINLRINKFNVTQGHIKVKGEGKVNLFIDNYVALKGSLNSDGNPKNLDIYYNGDKNLVLENETNIVGTLYLKNADLSIKGGGSLDGNIISGGKNVTISGGSLIQKGIIFAPNSNIKILAGGQINGGVIGDKILVSGGAKITYDPVYAERLPIVPDDSSEKKSTQFKPGHFK